MISLRELSVYQTVDLEKKHLIDDILNPPSLKFLQRGEVYEELCDYCRIEPTKYCPKCHKRYYENDNFCSECLVSLKDIRYVDVKQVRSKPVFEFIKPKEFCSFDEIFSKDNFSRIDDFNFNIRKFKSIARNIKKSSLETMDALINENDILLDELNPQDKIILYAKSFTEVDFKSYGRELGYIKFNRISVDDRQTSSLMITTLIHELSHFIIKEMLTQILCTILDCSKNSLIESIAVYMLSYSPFTRLIDEYAAHTSEGRFTLFGYQDYSSFIQIEKSLNGEMTKGEIEITKSIGNTFSLYIKDIFESFIDWDLRSEIKEQFKNDMLESPNYEMLALENCNDLTDEGFIKAIWLILSEGFFAASQNIDKVTEYQNYL